MPRDTKDRVRTDPRLPIFNEHNRAKIIHRTPIFEQQPLPRFRLQRRKPQRRAPLTCKNKPNRSVAKIAHAIKQHHRIAWLARDTIVHLKTI